MTAPIEYIFYDGHCGLCHRWVKQVLEAGEPAGHFVFAPLQGDFIKTRLSDDQRSQLPDSIVVQTHDDRVLTRSTGVLYVMQQLGGFRRVQGKLGMLVPRPLRDAVYAGIAKIRHHLYARPNEACPMMPPELRERFRM
ncbi:MAG: DCC1-like thiol-disulfide oxidoreductase family protein [Rhodospirillales bacterium]|nr:DCC1-like thiol-disulfide oxidoreductase family protein [Rhodospirillales bacterium]